MMLYRTRTRTVRNTNTKVPSTCASRQRCCYHGAAHAAEASADLALQCAAVSIRFLCQLHALLCCRPLHRQHVLLYRWGQTRLTRPAWLSRLHLRRRNGVARGDQASQRASNDAGAGNTNGYERGDDGEQHGHLHARHSHKSQALAMHARMPPNRSEALHGCKVVCELVALVGLQLEGAACHSVVSSPGADGGSAEVCGLVEVGC